MSSSALSNTEEPVALRQVLGRVERRSWRPQRRRSLALQNLHRFIETLGREEAKQQVPEKRIHGFGLLRSEPSARRSVQARDMIIAVSTAIDVNWIAPPG